MALNENALNFIETHLDELKALLKTLCLIPSPSGHEEKKAEFILNWLKSNGAEQAYIDTAKNVVLPLSCGDEQSPWTVFMAHTDTVFPEITEPYYYEDDEKIYCPAVCDDTFAVATIMMTIKYMLKNHITPQRNLLFAANACEEGLGNLKGCQKLCADYSGKIREVYTIDGHYHFLVNRCVGSKRFLVCVHTEGGHSFKDFGRKNAIQYAAKIINDIYNLTVPSLPDTHTTYNVGTIQGGTTVNSIAAKAQFLCEYRSDSEICMQMMQEKFSSVFSAYNCDGVRVEVTVVGSRPCMKGVDSKRLAEISEQCMEICQRHTGVDCLPVSGSTDANIPMSQGIVAVCVGNYDGGNTHSRKEWISKSSIETGFKITAELILSHV